MKRLQSILIILFFIGFSDAYSQKKVKPFHVSELKKGDLSNSTFKDFPDAKARILFDYGELKFIPIEERYIIERSRHLRIKFLEDTVWSAHKLGLTSFEKDDLISIIHYSLEDGKVKEKEIKMDWPSFNKYTAITKEVVGFKSGDILDFEFIERLESVEDFPSWQFEYEIPVDYSEWYAEIPGMFKYRPIFKGYVPFLLNSSEILKDENKNWVEIDGFYVYQYRFVCAEIDPFEKVIYSPSSKNYLTSVDFYLEGIETFKSQKAVAGQSWEQVASQLYRDEKIIGKIKKFNASEIIKELDLDSNQMRNTYVIYNWLNDNTSWNGDIGIFAEQSLDELIQSRSGSIADINLTLIALLEEAGINARPVILRTIDQGEVNMEFPNSSQFNYLVCWIDIQGKKLLLDASEDCLVVGILRAICLNNRGLVVTPRFEEWVDLEETRVAKFKIVTHASIQDDKLISFVQISKLNYYAYEDCQNFNNLRELVKIEPGLVISNVKLSKRDSILSGNRIEFDCDADSIVSKSGSTWTFEPFWFERIKSSPFNAKERKYPIVFPYLFEYHWNFIFTFSDNIEILDFPENDFIAISDNTIQFTYQVIPLDGVLQLNAQLSILRRRYKPYLYEEILEFYEDIYEKFTNELKIKVKH